VRTAGHLLLTADAVGGVWQYSTDLAAALRPFGFDVTLAALGPPLSDAQRREAASIPNLHVVETGLELEWLAAEPAPVLAAERRLAEMAGDLRVDLVQLHTPALVSAGRFRCLVVAMLHSCVATWWSAVKGGLMPEDFGWRTDLVRQGLERAALAVAPTAAFAQAARQQYGVAPLAVHNGRSLHIPRRHMQDGVFTVGRLWDEGKNVRVLDEAAQRMAIPVKAAGPVSGPGGAAVRFGKVQALGPLDTAALADQLASRPVFVSTALYEPFGLAVLEAAIAGCALILSDIPTLRELWEGCAIFVDPRDAEGLAVEIEAIIGDAAARQEAGRRARERARRYTPAATAATMAGHYAALRRRAAA
jgi:glycosyltransferase involved in cell wall biosynthesis